MKLKVGFVFLFTLLSSFYIQSQTQGTLSFSCSTTAPTGDWGDKHVLAIWIETATGEFVKTNTKYGHEDDHLTSWVANTSKNTVDATTGATLNSYQTRSVIWDGTDINRVVVADGDYKIFIEMGWGRNKTDDHSVLSFTFTKGETALTLNPTGNDHYSDVVLEWAPTATLINDINEKSLAIYPNPSSGLFQLSIKQSVEGGRIQIENSVGRTVYTAIIPENLTGNLEVDIRDNPRGVYFINVISYRQKFTYKVILK